MLSISPMSPIERYLSITLQLYTGYDQVFVKGIYGGTFGEVFVEPKFSLADSSHLMFLLPAAFQTAQ